MDTVTAVGNRIIQLCNERGLTINELAKKSRVASSSVHNILYGKSQNPKIITIKMLCDGLGISLAAFFDAALFEDLEMDR